MRQRDKDRVLQWWFKGRVRYQKLAVEIQELLDADFDPRVPADSVYTIRARLKGEDRLVEKVDQHYGGRVPVIDDIPKVVSDLLGLRIICLRLGDVDRVEKFIEALKNEGKLEYVKQPERKQTFILPVNPGEGIPEGLDLQYTGYSSIHYQVRLGSASQPASVLKELEAEIQVRTILEEAWGEIDHKYRYELSRTGVQLPEQVKLGFYSFSAYLQAAALHAEYLARATEGVAASADIELSGPPAKRSDFEAKREDARKAIAQLVGFAPSEQTLTYLLRRTRQEGVAILPISSWLSGRIVNRFRQRYQEIVGAPPFETEADRQIDLVNLSNFGLLAVRRGENLATSGLESVLRRRQNATETGPRGFFVLRKPATGDDDFWGQTIDFGDIRRLTLNITPNAPTDYWRLGLKFSEDGKFLDRRYGGGMALFHLAKPAEIPELHWRYFGPDGSSQGEVPLLLGYSNSPVSIVCTPATDILRIDVFDKNGVIQLRQEYAVAPQRFARVVAWGDGQDYVLTVESLIAS